MQKPAQIFASAGSAWPASLGSRRMRRLVPVGAMVAATLAVIPVGPVPSANATSTITVTTTAQGLGGSGCSLQEAILDRFRFTARRRTPENVSTYLP